MHEIAVKALDAAMGAGADYADVRAVEADRESISVQDATVEGVTRASSRGVGIRVLAEGSWGFAGTALLGPGDIAGAARSAVELALAAAPTVRRPVRLSEHDAVRGRWVTPHDTDPFDVSTDDKLGLLLAATAAAHEVPSLTHACASFDAWRTSTWLVSSDGTDVEQTILQVGGGVQCLAIADGQLQVRSFPNSFRGYCGTGGWEDIVALRLAERAPPHAEEALALLRAPALPAAPRTLVLDGSQLALQVHESVGHPLELDRVLGWEAAYAGTSFVSPEDRGTLRYGSELVNLTLDSTTPKALGTFGFDDEGVPAGRHPLVVGGVLQGFLTSRETATYLSTGTRSNGTMRADSWGSMPLVRMTNIHLEPGTGTLEDLLADAEEGVFMATNRSWSIDDRRVNFAFGCEAAWEIRGGRLGRLFRNPTYTGRTTAFWGSCDAIAGPEAWQVYGTPNCGKGQPAQSARVAHGAAPARFRGVTTGSA